MENIPRYIKWKNGQIDSCKEKNFASLFHLIHNQEDRIFCEYTQHLQKVSVKYSDFEQYCYKVATFLKANLHSEKNSFVGLMMENSIDWVATFWALLMIGYKPLLINCKLPATINKSVLAIMKTTEVVTTKDINYQELDVTPVVFDQNSISNLQPIENKTWADEIAMCTTASSLNYKICVYSGENMFYQLANSKDVISKYCPRVKKHYKQRLKLLAFLPLYHVFGLIATYLWFSLYGRTIVWLKNYSADTIIQTIREFEVTHIFAVPLFWNTIAKHINREIESLGQKTKNKFTKAQKLSLNLQNCNWRCGTKIAQRMFKQIVNKTFGKSVNFIISGGGYQSDSTMKLFNSIGYPLAIGYGTSEVGIICFENRNKPKYRLLGTCGKPLNSVQVKVENNTLWVKGKSTCNYFYYKDGTRVDLNGQWFDTQDIAKIDNDGYISILGRKDDVIVSENGEKINPDLIEKTLFLPSVINYVIVPIQQKTSLIVQLRNKYNSLDLPKVINEIKTNVDQVNKIGYNIESIYYTNDLLAPKNAIKVSRKILKTQIEMSQIHLSPLSNLHCEQIITEDKLLNEFENDVRKIIAEVIGKDPTTIGVNQHLILDLSVSSLEYFTILTKLEDEFNIKFNFKDKSCQTISSFASYIINAKKGAK